MNGRVAFNKFTSIPSDFWRTTQSVRKFAPALQRCLSHVWNLIVVRPLIHDGLNHARLPSEKNIVQCVRRHQFEGLCCRTDDPSVPLLRQSVSQRLNCPEESQVSNVHVRRIRQLIDEHDLDAVLDELGSELFIIAIYMGCQLSC
jgi:hypothetical protein